MQRSQIFKIAAGASVCAIAAAAYIHGNHGASRLQDEIDRAVSQTIALGGHSWARATVNGQHVTLAGAAPTEVERDSAAREILLALGPGGPLFGAVDAVDTSAVEIAPVTTPRSEFRLRLIKRGDTVTAFGATTGDAMNALLQDAFGEVAPTIASDLKQDLYEDAENWIAAVGSASQALALLEDGSLRIEGRVMSLEGSAATAQAGDLARGFLATITPFFEVTTTITTPLSEAASFEACEKSVASAAAVAPVTFAPQSSRLQEGVEASLAGLVDALASCSAFSILVEAHTDKSGSSNANLSLSLRRAERVAEALRDAGVSAPIITRGLGESAPLVPIERTEADRDANRRVEIRIIQQPALSESE
jgi:OOP family OmpA-OmpF porin